MMPVTPGLLKPFLDVATGSSHQLRSRPQTLVIPPVQLLRRQLALYSTLVGYAKKHGFIIATLVLLLVGMTFYVFHARHGAPRSTAQAGTSIPRKHVRRSVAVLGFRNLPGRPEDSWLSRCLRNVEYGTGRRRRAPNGFRRGCGTRQERIATQRRRFAWQIYLAASRTTPGADVVVVGSYTMIPADPKRRIRLDVRLQDTASGETIAEDSVSGDENDLFNLVSDLRGKLRRSLRVAAPSEGIEIATRAALPSNEEAARLYAEGRARLWAFDYFAARDLLAKAIAADPAFPLAHAALSDVRWHTGYDAKARVEARRALDLSNQLSQEQRLLVEGQYQRTAEQWPKAVETYRSLFRLFPDNLDYGLLFASAQMHLSASDSLQTLAVNC